VSELSHLDEEGAARMVDVGAKESTARSAVAVGTLYSTTEVLGLLASGGLPKGDTLATARVAGVMGAKRTADLVPLCHAVGLSSVDVEFVTGEYSIQVRAVAHTTGPTGVEMEALTAVHVAALTLHDMIKAVDPAATLEGVYLERKEGGRSGSWQHPRTAQ